MSWLKRLSRLGIILISLPLLLWLVYVLSGYYLLPYLVRTQLFPVLGKQVDGAAKARVIRFDPFSLNLVIEEFSIGNGQLGLIASTQSLELDIDAGRSLKELALVSSLHIKKPLLKLQRDSQGRWLPDVPKSDNNSSGSFPFLFTDLRIDDGRVEVRDYSKGRLHELELDPVFLSVNDLGSSKDQKARFKLSFGTQRQEKIAAEGWLILSPLRSDGKVQLSGITPTPWLEWLAPQFAAYSGQGAFSSEIEYSFGANGDSLFEIKSGNLKSDILQLVLQELKQPDVKLTGLAVDGLAFSFKDQTLRWNRLNLAEVVQGAYALKNLVVNGLNYSIENQSSKFGQIEVAEGKLANFNFSKAYAANGVFDKANQQISLEQVKFSESSNPDFKFASATGHSLTFALNTGQLQGKSLVIDKGTGFDAGFEQAELKDFEGSASGQTFHAAAIDLKKIAAKSSTLGAVHIENPDLALMDKKFQFSAITASDMGLPLLKIAGAKMGKGAVSLTSQAFILDDLVLDELVTTGSVDGDSRPPPSLADAKQVSSNRPERQGAGRVQPQRYIPRAAKISHVEIDNPKGSLKDHKLTMDSLISHGGEIDVRVKALKLLKVDGLPAVSLAAKTGRHPAPPWRVRIDLIKLSDYSSVFRDETVNPHVRLGFGPISLNLSDFSTERGRQFKFRLDAGSGERAKIELDGQARLEPQQADLRFGVDQFWLRSIQPYWQDHTNVELKRGKLNLWGDITVRNHNALKIDYSGGSEIVDFDSVNKAGEAFTRWKMLKLDGLLVSTLPHRFAARSIISDEPYARVVVDKNGKLNLTRELLVKPAGGTAPKATTDPAHQSILPVVVGLLKIKDLSLDFSDYRLQPGFTANIKNMTGTITGLSSQPDATARVMLEGNINQNSPVKLYGHTNPFQFRDNTDINLEFQGLNLTTLSAYSSKFAGYRIEKGKLDLTLHYKLVNKILQVDNRVILDQLTLGEKVDSPSALNLPVDLAVAVLKDSEGKIDFELPVTGDMTNPNFSLASLFGAAIREFFIKLVTSPMTLINNLAKTTAEDLGFVDFKPGADKLNEAATTKLNQIADVLKQRPGLNLDVRGVADPDSDRMALAEQALNNQLQNVKRDEMRAKGQRPGSNTPLDLSEEDYRRLFLLYYQQKYPGELKQASASADMNLNQARRKVLENWPIGELDIRNLAHERSERIRDFLIRDKGLPDQRIYLLDVRMESGDASGIKTYLSLSNH